MRAKDKCPSCFQPIAPTDFLCANCELILDPSQVPERPVGEVSVVRRMLEAPQRGLPAGKPNPRPPKSAPTEGLEGPTRRLDLGPELAGVPVVVATLTRKSLQLSELEAWIVSLVDGLNDAGALAKKAGLREFELRVVLRTLHDKQVIDFADEPLSDADLDMPAVMGTLDEDEPAPDSAPAPASASPDLGANADRRDGRFMAPPSRATAEPPPAPPPEPQAAQAPTGRRGPLIRAGRAAQPPAPPAAVEREREHTPIVQGRAEPPVLTPEGGRPSVRAVAEPPYPGLASASRAPVVRAPPGLPVDLPPAPPGGGARPPGLPADLPQAPRAGGARPPGLPADLPPAPRTEQTDPRIAYTGNVNRKVLDALKKVKRADAPASSTPKQEPEHHVADVLARDTLQVALRMEQGGRLDEAIRFLERSIAQSPEAASLYNRLGIILMRERADYRRAETLIRKATELSPENAVYGKNLQQVISQQAMRSRGR